MVGGSRQSLPSWISAAAASRVDIDGNVSSVSDTMFYSNAVKKDDSKPVSLDANLGLMERAFSAAGAAVVSAIIVNPLDVAKVFARSNFSSNFAFLQTGCCSCFQSM